MTAPRVNPDFSQLGNSVFETVYIYDKLYANEIVVDNTVFTGDVNLDVLRVRKYFSVGTDEKLLNVNNETKKIGINTLNPTKEIVAIGDVNIGGNVDISNGRLGINSDYIDPNGERQLEVGLSAKIGKFIYDRNNNKGANTYVLSRDQEGIIWRELSTEVQEGIFLQEEGSQVGQGVSFTTLNFVERNSAGILTETLGITSSGITGLATIYSNDFWGVGVGTYEGGNAGNNIYRNSYVGIWTNNPLLAFQVGYGVSHHVSGITSTGEVGIGTTNPDTLNNRLFVHGNATITGITSLALNGDKVTTGGNLTVGADLAINGPNLTSDETSFNLLNSTPTTINFGGNATSIEIGKSDVNGVISINSKKDSTDSTKGALVVDGGVGIAMTLNVGGKLGVTSDADFDQKVNIDGELELNSFLKDVNNTTASNKNDYRLSAVGTGVSWRPSGVETKRTIWVSMNGDDANSGLLEGDAKRTIGSAAAVAEENDTIVVRPGVFYENNPIGLRTDVTVTGQDLRLVTIIPLNTNKDVFHVRRGCLVENLNFSGSSVSIAYTGSAAVAFPPTESAVNAGISSQAVTGYTELGPANEGPSGRWRSPYIRNCTNFMTKSIGMKIDGHHATASTPGANLKSMVCDSFTQYNENGIGVSITNEGYAQLVSIFTINCDIGIYASSGGSCDLTNSNSSFGNFGLVAVGVGTTEYTARSNVEFIADQDEFVALGVTDSGNNYRRPYDGQALWFKVDLNNYPESSIYASEYASTNGVITAPFEELFEVKLLDGGNNSNFSESNPPSVIIRDFDSTLLPKGPQSVAAQVTATVSAAGSITEFNIVSNGRNYLSTQNIVVDIDGDTGIATAIMKPIYFTVSSATEPSNIGLSTITLNEFIPYSVFQNDGIEMRRISRILTSSHSFEYIGTGIDINSSLPFQGGVPIKDNEVVAKDGAQVPFTSTDQKGNFDIGEGLQVDQTTSTVRGRDFSRAIQAEVTPLILALR